MSARRTLGVVIGRASTATVAEALRAAVGLTLRGDRVALAIAREALAAAGPAGARAVATLTMFGHRVDVVTEAGTALAALDGDAIEVWGDASTLVERAGAGPAPRLHLVRAGRRALTAAPARVLHLAGEAADDQALAPDDAPGRRWHAVLDAILAADVTVVW